MRLKADIALCFGPAQGDVCFEHVLGSGATPWAQLVSFLTGRRAAVHQSNAPGDVIQTLTNLPDLLRGQGYRCQAEAGLELPFVWNTAADLADDGRPLLSAHQGLVKKPQAWVIALEPNADGRRWRVGVTPPGGAEARAITEPVSIIDLLPSLCALLGLPVPYDTQGKALRALWRGESPLPDDYAWAYDGGAEPLIWNGQRGVRLDAVGNAGLLDADLRPTTATPAAEDLIALGAAMLRGLDPLPYPQNRYRVKRHPDNLWLDKAYRQLTDPGIPKLPVVTQRRFYMRPTKMEVKARG